MSSDNPSGGDNQQGRSRGSLTPEYVAGFVDGEGCFSVSIHPHPSVRYGTRWLVTAKGPNSNVLTYSVYRRANLESVIIPFFDRYPLVSRKQEDFMKFREIVVMMQQRLHRTDDGFRKIVELAFSMNQRGKQRRYRIEDVLAKPSETARRAPVKPAKIQSDPHGDMRRAAEMTAPLAERLL